jgi:superfamily I DNA and/or RNA helicase
LKVLDKNSTSDWQAFIAPIANRLMDFSKRNPLYNLEPKSTLLNIQNKVEFESEKLVLELDSPLKNLLKKHRFIIRETGLNTLYLSFGTYALQNDELGKLPFYLIPVQTKLNKDKNVVEIELNWEEKIINPLLSRLLKEKYNLVPDFDQCTTSEAFLGIFNYKKYVILDEIGSMEESNLSNPIRELYDFQPKPNEKVLPLSELDNSLIADADYSQRIIIKKSLKNESFCVQGPPGTGKSQTISNIISANLAAGKKVLFVSEKKAAIDVVYDKLEDVNLHHNLCKITDSKSDKKEFVNSLEGQWTTLKTESGDRLKKADYSAAFLRIEKYLDQLHQNRPELGASLKDLLIGNSFVKYDHQLSNIPTILEWDSIKKILDPMLQDYKKEQLSTSELKAILNLNGDLFRSKEFEQKFAIHTKVLRENLALINEVQANSGLHVESISELIRFCIQARIISGLKFKEKIDILRDDSKLKKFKTESKKYIKLNTEFENLKIDVNHWSTIPSIETIQFLQKNLDKNGFFSSAKRKVDKLILAHSNKPIRNIEQLLIHTMDYLEVQKKLNSSISKLKTDFQILNPNTEIDEMNLILSKAEYQKELFEKILDQDQQLIEKLDQLNPVVDKVQHSSKVLFALNYGNIEELKEKVSNTVDAQNYILKNQKELKGLDSLTKENIRFFNSFEGDLTNLDSLIFNLNIEQIIKRSKVLSEIDSKSLNADLKTVIDKRRDNLSVNSAQLINQLKSEFSQLETLLITPAGRLKEKEKALKKEVRAGKRILTHEFSKTKRFKAIRELCELESKHWVFKMKNVWMMNPLSVSEILPFEKEQFDLLIIDEASQIPEEDIIPALYRAKQVIIVGDKMQMPPSNYFSGNEVGPSILDTAHYRLNNYMLKWHYRSKNPELISFSNHSFYDSQLILSPAKDPNSQVLNYHFVPNSNYKEGVNTKEAKELIAYLEKHLKELNGKEIGIATFSLAQQKVIEKELARSKALSTKLEDESLFVRNLENLQGDECDILLISIGYGPDKDGKLSLNMGALSKNGGHNRLNVLITRAREQVHVFSSIPNGSIRLSDNEGINYLRDYLEFIQQPNRANNWTDLSIDYTSSKIVITGTESERIEALLSRVSVLKSIGFDVEVQEIVSAYLAKS